MCVVSVKRGTNDRQWPAWFSVLRTTPMLWHTTHVYYYMCEGESGTRQGNSSLCKLQCPSFKTQANKLSSVLCKPLIKAAYFCVASSTSQNFQKFHLKNFLSKIIPQQTSSKGWNFLWTNLTLKNTSRKPLIQVNSKHKNRLKIGKWSAIWGIPGVVWLPSSVAPLGAWPSQPHSSNPQKSWRN